MHNPTKRQEAQATVKQALIEAALLKTEVAVEALIPPWIAPNRHKAILAEVLSCARCDMERLTVVQLRNKGEINRPISNAIATARSIVACNVATRRNLQ